MNSVIAQLKQHQLAIIGVIVALISTGLFMARSGLIDELTLKEAELNSRLRIINQNVKNSKNISDDVATLAGYVTEIEAHLFASDERSVNVDFFYSFEDRLDVHVSDVNQLKISGSGLGKDGPNELKIYSAINYDINVTADFQDIVEFLYEIHAADALMRVAGFQIDQAKHSVEKLSANIRVVVLAEKNKN